MSFARFGLTVGVGVVFLFVWYGTVLNFPWGIGAVDNVSATTGESYVAAAPGLEEAPPGTWTTDAFDERLGNGISTLATDRTFAWIIAVPSDRYDMARYFTGHTLALIGIVSLLSLALWILSPLPRTRRLAAILFVGGAATIATYGEMMTWWGLPASYGVGETFNLLVGWSLALLIMDRLLPCVSSTVSNGDSA